MWVYTKGLELKWETEDKGTGHLTPGQKEAITPPLHTSVHPFAANCTVLRSRTSKNEKLFKPASNKASQKHFPPFLQSLLPIYYGVHSHILSHGLEALWEHIPEQRQDACFHHPLKSGHSQRLYAALQPRLQTLLHMLSSKKKNKKQPNTQAHI